MAKKTKKEYWLFTIITNYNKYVNCFFESFPTKDELMDVCHDKNSTSYAIINVTKLTEEQYVKLTGKEVSE